jgi:hypothetical protein
MSGRRLAARSRQAEERGRVRVDRSRDPDPVPAVSHQRADAGGLGRPGRWGRVRLGVGKARDPMLAHALRPMQQPGVRLRGRRLRRDVLYRLQVLAGGLSGPERRRGRVDPGAAEVESARRRGLGQGSSIPPASACNERSSAPPARPGPGWSPSYPRSLNCWVSWSRTRRSRWRRRARRARRCSRSEAGRSSNCDSSPCSSSGSADGAGRMGTPTILREPEIKLKRTGRAPISPQARCAARRGLIQGATIGETTPFRRQARPVWRP